MFRDRQNVNVVFKQIIKDGEDIFITNCAFVDEIVTIEHGFTNLLHYLVLIVYWSMLSDFEN